MKMLMYKNAVIFRGSLVITSFDNILIQRCIDLIILIDRVWSASMLKRAIVLKTFCSASFYLYDVVFISVIYRCYIFSRIMLCNMVSRLTFFLISLI